MKHLFFALRPKQWIKNLFIFLPLIFGNKLFSFPTNLKVTIAFVLFCLASSAVYLINDLLDIGKDKQHPLKRLRPIARGTVSVHRARTTALILVVAVMAASFALNTTFAVLILVYFIFNVFYTTVLKEIVIIDVCSIAAFFLLRIVIGGVVAEVPISHWIILMTVLLALFLGFNKRRQELKLYKRKAKAYRPVLKKYSWYFIDQMIAVITSTIVVTYLLYTVDSRTVNQFGPHLLLTVPFVYYGIFRYLYLMHKLRKDGDPTRTLLSDPPMQWNLVLWIAISIAVIYFKI